MNLTLEQLPSSCDVLVVGAGPAGSATALELARSGLKVVLVDQHTFPRDKICGDALIPDAHAGLKRLGVYNAVMNAAQTVGHVRCVAPRGGQVNVPALLAVLPRRVLDDIVCRAAVAAGACMVAPARFVETLEEGGAVVGARLRGNASVQDIRARWVVLATGAVPQALIAAGVCQQQLPSGVALRGYVKNSAMEGEIQTLDIVWHQALRPGYGWVFPCGQGVFNIGVGVAQSHARGVQHVVKKEDANLRHIFKAFTELYPPARNLMQGGQLMNDLKGAPLRCGLKGALASKPGLLVTGEAVGSTYAFTGEGIGKAIETGLLAAQAIVSSNTDATVRETYAEHLNQLKPRFDLYEHANQINAHPWLFDLLIWRAKSSPRLRERMVGVLNETSNPGHLLSAKGMWRLFTSG